MHFLILSCNTGGGHNSAAAAISEYFIARGHQCESLDCLDFLSPAKAKMISEGHVLLYRKAPKLFGFGYRFEEQHTPKLIVSQCEACAGALCDAVRQTNCDALLCVHPFSALIVTAAREQYGLNLPACFIATDYTCSPGVAQSSLDTYFIPHAALEHEFIVCGVPAHKLVCSGIPVRTAFYDHIPKEEARRQLHLPTEGKLVLMACGSMGAGPMEELTRLLDDALCPGDQLAVICGTNKKLQARLETDELSTRVRIVGFTHQMSLYMDAADVILTKPGGLTTTEVLAKNLPLVYIDAVPGCETRNLEFMTRRGYARTANTPALLTKLICQPLQNDEALARCREQMHRDFSRPAVDILYHTLQTQLHF